MSVNFFPVPGKHALLMITATAQTIRAKYRLQFEFSKQKLRFVYVYPFRSSVHFYSYEMFSVKLDQTERVYL